MTFNFNPDLSDPVSQVRQLIGDTTQASADLPDETIEAYLTQGLSVLRTAAQCCRDLAAKYVKRVTTGSDHQQTIDSDIYKHYMDLAATLEARVGKDSAATPDVGFTGVYAGCISQRPSFNPRETYGDFWEPDMRFPFG